VNGGADRDGAVVQVFALAYLCQTCKSVPEVFLIRRGNQKLTLSGRAPIEHVAVPFYIPKTVQRFYSGAVVAHQSGQTLAGNFMLRTLIEQWARFDTRAERAKREGTGEPTEAKWKADQVLDVYAESLPSALKGKFGTLKETYGDLSADIHAAAGAPEAFDKATADINRHFDARRLFEL
jgi:hypothetical protein